jgi:hypothetical protein
MVFAVFLFDYNILKFAGNHHFAAVAELRADGEVRLHIKPGPLADGLRYIGRHGQRIGIAELFIIASG